MEWVMWPKTIFNLSKLKLTKILVTLKSSQFLCKQLRNYSTAFSQSDSQTVTDLKSEDSIRDMLALNMFPVAKLLKT